MINAEVTSLSSKGQVVIPDRIRKILGLSTGRKMMVITDGSNLLFKPLEEPKLNSFNKLIRESRKFARESGLKKEDVKKAIKAVRHENRS
jgi:AbrB family looped-hinge helix DNA binding protein